MTVQLFFDNPNFLACVRLLRQLHQMIREGVDETAEGEELRERMDEPARDRLQDEIDCLNGISADFYTLSDPPWQVQPSLPSLQQRMETDADGPRSAGLCPGAGSAAQESSIPRRRYGSLRARKHLVRSWRSGDRRGVFPKSEGIRRTTMNHRFVAEQNNRNEDSGHLRSDKPQMHDGPFSLWLTGLPLLAVPAGV